MTKVALTVFAVGALGGCGESVQPAPSVGPVIPVPGAYLLEACSRGGFEPDGPPPCRISGTASSSSIADSAELVLTGSNQSGSATLTVWEHGETRGSTSTTSYTALKTGTYTVAHDSIYTTIPTGLGSGAKGMVFVRSKPTFASPSTDWIAGWFRTNFDTRFYLRRR